MRKHKNAVLGGVSAILAISVSASANDDHSQSSMFDFDHVSCTGGPHEIRIVVSGIKKAVGLINAELYPDRQDVFLRYGGRIKEVRYAAKKPFTSFCVTAPGPGPIAVAIYHDKNANGDFDKTGLGLPAEPWGLSNNPKPRLAPPKVSESIINLTEDGADLEIRLR